MADEPDDEPVIAPGGPRSEESVVQVEPGDIVRRSPEGTYSVVPRDEPA